MSNVNWFKFEDKDIDFPFYKKNPYIPKWGWIVLFIAFFFGFFFNSHSTCSHCNIMLYSVYCPRIILFEMGL